jgi:hypothetical protein
MTNNFKFSLAPKYSPEGTKTDLRTECYKQVEVTSTKYCIKAGPFLSGRPRIPSNLSNVTADFEYLYIYIYIYIYVDVHIR